MFGAVRRLSGIASELHGGGRRSAGDPQPIVATAVATNGQLAYPPVGQALHNRSREEFTGGWKCAWTFSVAQCMVLLLPAGSLLTHAAMTALKWAGSTLTAALEGGSLTAFNPSAVDDENLFIRVAVMNTAEAPRLTWGAAGRLLAQRANHVLWLRASGKQGTRVHRAFPGDDARGLWLDQWSLIAVYSRIRSSRIPMIVSMHLRNLSDHHAPEIQLRIGGVELRRKEKNWMPFVAAVQARSGTEARQLFLSYAIYPHHVVITCNAKSGFCTRVYNTTSQAVWSRLLVYHGLLEKASASAPAVALAGGQRHLGIGHASTGLGVYFHFFYEMQSTPPFTVLRTSRPFRFSTSRCPESVMPPMNMHGMISGPANELLRSARLGTASSADLGARLSCSAHRIQYAAGMHLMSNGSVVVITYGFADVAPLRTAVSLKLVQQMLSDGGDGLLRYPFCVAKLREQMACDDATCASSGPGQAVLAVCPTLSDRYPYNGGEHSFRSKLQVVSAASELWTAGAPVKRE